MSQGSFEKQPIIRQISFVDSPDTLPATATEFFSLRSAFRLAENVLEASNRNATVVTIGESKFRGWVMPAGDIVKHESGSHSYSTLEFLTKHVGGYRQYVVRAYETWLSPGEEYVGPSFAGEIYTFATEENGSIGEGVVECERTFIIDAWDDRTDDQASLNDQQKLMLADTVQDVQISVDTAGVAQGCYAAILSVMREI